MKALSLRQPWATSVLHLGKGIENRRWNTNFRGEFLIHAAKGMTRAEYEGAVDFCEDVMGVARCFEIARAFEDLPRGGFVGVARLVDVVKPRPEFLLGGVEKHYPPSVKGEQWRWHMREQFGFILEDVRATMFVPYAGALGFFDVPDAIASAVLAPDAVAEQRANARKVAGIGGR